MDLNSVSYSNRSEDLDKRPDQVSQEFSVANPSILKKLRKYDSSIDRREVERVRNVIVDTWQHCFEAIWGNIYIRHGAVSGDTKVFEAINNNFDFAIAESILSEIGKISSIASSTLKQPFLEIKTEDSSQVSSVKDISNTVLDDVFYKGLSTIVKAFSSSLSKGISFIHAQTCGLDNEILLESLSAYRCMWDLSVVASDIHKGSFFFIEDFLNADKIREMYSSELVDKAFSVRASNMDTFPLNDMESKLSKGQVVLKGTKFAIGKDKSNAKMQYQVSGEFSTNLHKITTIYIRNKKETSKGEEGSGYRNSVTKIVYINNLFIGAFETGLKYIPVSAFSPLESESCESHNKRYRSVYDVVQSELMTIAQISSSIVTCMQNSANNTIFVNEASIPSAHKTNHAIRNNIIPVRNTQGIPLSEIVTSIQNAGVPAGMPEMIQMCRNSISEKLNILTQQSGATKSAEQDRLKIDNQVRLSSSTLETLDSSIIQIGEILVDIIRNIISFDAESILFRPDRMENITPEAVSDIRYFLKHAYIELEESEYFTTKSEKDLQKLEKVSAFAGKNFSMDQSALMKIAGISEETIKLVEEAESRVSQQQAKAQELEIQKMNLEIEKVKAEIFKLQSESLKNTAEAKKKDAESAEIKTNKKPTNKK